MTSLFINLLTWIDKIVGNYGWSIVVFTLVIRLVLLPLDIKSKKSMRAISKIQPKLQALQKKYANDKDKLNQKTMELYRKEHVSPTAGCLPMLISLPILWIMWYHVAFMPASLDRAQVFLCPGYERKTDRRYRQPWA